MQIHDVRVNVRELEIDLGQTTPTDVDEVRFVEIVGGCDHLSKIGIDGFFFKNVYISLWVQSFEISEATRPQIQFVDAI